MAREKSGGFYAFDAIARQKGYLYALRIRAPPLIAAIRQQFSRNSPAIQRKSSAITRIQFGSAELLRILRSHEGYTRDFVGKYRIIV